MNSGTVDLIATDPPFNKGKDFHATPESLSSGARFQDRWRWDKDVHQTWIDKITDDFPKVMNVVQGSRNSYGDDMGAFLCFMAVRLLEMRRVLKPTGSIYLHCDPTASHYLKELMDAVFGKKNFRNEIIWHYSKWSNNASFFQKNHDCILAYGMGPNVTFNPEYSISLDKLGKLEKGYQINVANGVRQLIYYDSEKIKDVDPARYDIKVDRSTADPGTLLSDVWSDINILNSQSKERFGFPTQKPLALYMRIIKASSNKGDIVLDPFAGCATTLVAAEKLERQWVGIDIWEKAEEAVVERLNREGIFQHQRTRLSEKNMQTCLFAEDFDFTDKLPERTDDNEEAVPFLKTKMRVQEPKGEYMSRKEMYEHLLGQEGPICQGCDRVFDDSRYLQLDHKTPRSEGGINHISNRMLLCGPCNNVKSNKLTLSGLRDENRRKGFMAKNKE